MQYERNERRLRKIAPGSPYGTTSSSGGGHSVIQAVVDPANLRNALGHRFEHRPGRSARRHSSRGLVLRNAWILRIFHSWRGNRGRRSSVGIDEGSQSPAVALRRAVPEFAVLTWRLRLQCHPERDVGRCLPEIGREQVKPYPAPIYRPAVCFAILWILKRPGASRDRQFYGSHCRSYGGICATADR